MLTEDIGREMEAEERLARLAEAYAAADPKPGEPRVLQPGAVYVSAFRGTNDLMLRSSDPDSIDAVIAVVKFRRLLRRYPTSFNCGPDPAGNGYRRRLLLERD